MDSLDLCFNSPRLSPPSRDPLSPCEAGRWAAGSGVPVSPGMGPSLVPVHSSPPCGDPSCPSFSSIFCPVSSDSGDGISTLQTSLLAALPAAAIPVVILFYAFQLLSY